MQNIGNEMAMMQQGQQQAAPAQQPMGQSQAPMPGVGQADSSEGGPENGMGGDANIAAQIEQHMDSLKPVQKAFIAQYLTPELTQIMGMVLGQEAFDYFKQFADPELILVPLPRKQVMEQLQAQQQNSGEAPPAQAGMDEAESNTQEEPEMSNQSSGSLIGSMKTAKAT